MSAIEVRGLSKEYGEVVANDDLSFSVEEGEVFGYLGPNGAGKTTTIRTLMGFQSPTAGTATVLGADVRDEDALVDAKRRVGYLPANPAFDEQVTGDELLDLHAEFKGDERREELLELFDPPLDRKIREYSTGNVQKLGLVQAFMHDPDLAILDEPTSGLDPLMQQRFNEFVRDEKRAGKTVFLSSHVLSEVRRVCDRVGILRDGVLVTTETVADLLHRSGKAVHLRAAEPASRLDLGLDGVHDLDVHAVEADGGETDATGDGGETTLDDAPVTEARFTYTGDVNALVARLADYDLVDLDVEEAPLEDVFMRFYGDDEPAPAAPAAGGTGATTGGGSDA
jgi:ABC-2 type transport system ATP-binding protein